MTHEETVTFHAREIQSYKQLPQLWYHFSVKERDEPRSRGGLLRVREFIMKDAYSFDRDEDGVRVSFEANREAYKKIFARCGIEAYDVQAESGIMGGEVQRRLPRARRLGREHARHLRERRLRRRHRGGPRDTARARVPRAARRAGGDRDAGRDHDRGARGVPRDRRVGDVEGDAGREGRRDARARARARRRPAQRDEAATTRCAAPHGRRRTTRSARRSAPAAARSARSASTGEVVADEALREGQFVAGANRDGWHLRGVEAGRDYEPAFADLREPHEGDRCPSCGGALQLPDRDRGRPHLQLRQLLLEAARRDVPRRGGQRAAARSAAATASGRRASWRRPSSSTTTRTGSSGRRRSRRTTCTSSRSPAPTRSRSQAAEALSAAGLDVLLDDRDLRAGEKFADADLIGAPLRVTAGKKSLEDGKVDVRDRAAGDRERA